MVRRFDHPWPNSNIVATESIKNIVYVTDKECMKVVSMEELMVILGRYFTSLYPQISSKPSPSSKPTMRLLTNGEEHHGIGDEGRLKMVIIHENLNNLSTKLGEYSHHTSLKVAGALHKPKGMRAWAKGSHRKRRINIIIYTVLPQSFSLKKTSGCAHPTAPHRPKTNLRKPIIGIYKPGLYNEILPLLHHSSNPSSYLLPNLPSSRAPSMVKEHVKHSSISLKPRTSHKPFGIVETLAPKSHKALHS
ncbi:hypothetical protein ZWY2020_027796 [Hordeum vulgare]|nr:hypothetical protein ZWY2020_027796 [Hordeum vulgare]